MANPSTTHVIEIDTGIGEPAFIPLTLGQELQPISVGKKGMWRIESPQVKDVHAFFYFDGNSLFIQSADETAAATVDGYKIGKAWTELHAPCKIDVGGARLRFRSLLPDNDSALTVVKPAPPVQGAPGGPAGQPGQQTRPPARTSTTGQRPAAPLPPATPSQPAPPPPPAAGAPPASFPKADRPFKPGEFIAADDESTRFAPVEAGNSRTGASAALSMSGANRPAAGAPPPALGDTTRQDAGSRAVQALGASNSGPYAPIGAGPMQAAMQGSMAPMMPPGMQQQGMQGMPNMQGSMPPMPGGSQYPNAPPPNYPPSQYPPGAPPPPGSSGAYGAMQQQGMNPALGPSMPPGGFGSMTPQGGQAPPPQGGLQEAIAKYKEMSPPKRILVILLPIAMALTVWSLWDDDEPPPKPKRVVAADGGAPTVVSGGASGATTTPPVGTPTTPPVGTPTSNWPAGVPCPPPNWPPNTPLPCTPNSATANPDPPPPPPPTKDAGAKEKDAGGKEPKDHGPTQPSGTKTLERQAVDAVAAGDPARAATIYEELSRRDPNNRVYAEAARILRAKLDGGAP